MKFVKKLRVVNHKGGGVLDVCTTLELVDQCEHVLNFAALNPISGSLSAKQPVRRKQPKSRFRRGIKLREFFK